MEEFIEQIGEMILESVPALAVLTFMISVYTVSYTHLGTDIEKEKNLLRRRNQFRRKRYCRMREAALLVKVQAEPVCAVAVAKQ